MPDPTPPANPRTLRTPADLIAAGLAPESALGALAAVGARYAVAVPPALAVLIEAPGDPLARQFVPDPAELETAPGERADPIGDDALSPIPGIVHRYPDRVLLKPTLLCPVYCRFCFRREHVGPHGGLLAEADLAAALAWIAARPAIREVILTGGDPLFLSARRLGRILRALDAMAHLETLRIHTRVPIATPGRVAAPLLGALATAKPLWLVVHANHARELAAPQRQALALLARAGVPLLGQSVLLRRVNDTAPALEALFRAMLACRVKPYYLHHLDPAPGTARFHVPVAEGRALLAALRGRLGGHGLPTYVVDIPGGFGKVPVGPDFFLPPAGVRDREGRVHGLGGPLAAAPGAG